MTNAHNWSYLYTHSRIVTSCPFDGAAEGATIQYDHQDGAYERMVTITGSIWPEWAVDGTIIRVGQANDMVDQPKSAIVLRLDQMVKPGDDLPAGTEFTLYRDTYLLTEDHVAHQQALYERNLGGMQYTRPREWLYENRYVFTQGIPKMDSITGDPKWPPAGDDDSPEPDGVEDDPLHRPASTPAAPATARQGGQGVRLGARHGGHRNRRGVPAEDGRLVFLSLLMRSWRDGSHLRTRMEPAPSVSP